MSTAFIKPFAYGVLNILSASGIVFANKLVLSTFAFHFLSALAFIHTIVTVVGLQVFSYFGVFTAKHLPVRSTAPLAVAYVGYIVLNNLNLRLNTVGFYQISKIAVAPAVLGLEAVFFGKRQSSQVVASIVIVCLGIAVSTVSDLQLGGSSLGWLVGVGAVSATAAYQIWAGSKQIELQASSFQLLHQSCPTSACLLAALIPVMEPLGLADHQNPKTLLGYRYTPASIIAIAASSVLGLLVSLSTFLVIGSTSSLTYNVVGHVKTVIILLGGVVIFGDRMPIQKLTGITLAMSGIIWYSQIKLAAATAATRVSAKSVEDGALAEGPEPEAVPLVKGSVSKLRRELSRSSSKDLPDLEHMPSRASSPLAHPSSSRSSL